MNQNSKYSPGVLSLLPMFYVGWSDCVLSPSEMELIHKKIKQFDLLSESDKALLISWTDPKNPPNASLFKEWVQVIKDRSNDLNDDAKRNLVELGIQMANQGTQNSDGAFWLDKKSKDALEDIEVALGIHNSESSNLILNQISEKDQNEKPKVSGFDILKMKSVLDDEFETEKDIYRAFLRDPKFKLEVIRDKEDHRAKVLEWLQYICDQGFGLISFPEYNGGEKNIGKFASFFEITAYHDISLTIKLGVQIGLFGGAIMNLGTKFHHDKYLNEAGRGKLLGCFAMTETGHGSNVRALETTAIYNHEQGTIIVNSPSEQAGKEYIGNALHGRMAAVFAQLIVNGKNHGIHCVLVPYRDIDGNLLDGIRVEDCGYKLGLNGVDNGRIWFNQVSVPKENLLDRFGDINDKGEYESKIENPAKRFFTMLGTLVGGRVSVALGALSASKKALHIAIKYGSKRRQFGSELGAEETILMDYPSHQRRLLPNLAKAYALDFALSKLKKLYMEKAGTDMRDVETLAAALKAYTTWFNTDNIQQCREACGGKGYLMENAFADLKADTDVFSTFEGDNVVLMQLVAKGLLSEFKQHFNEDGFFGVMRFLASRFGTSISEKNPYNIRRTDVNHLLDYNFQLHSFKYRKEKLLFSIVQRMRSYLKKQINAYDAYLKCQNHMLKLADAYAELIILESFQEGIQKVKDQAIQNHLIRMRNLFALSALEKDKGWFLENDYFVGAKSKAIRRVINKLCQEVRADANAYVDAFAIPSALVNAEIV